MREDRIFGVFLELGVNKSPIFYFLVYNRFWFVLNWFKNKEEQKSANFTSSFTKKHKPVELELKNLVDSKDRVVYS